MVFPSGRSARPLILGPLLFALIFGAAAAAQPSSYETAWRQARAASDRGDLTGAMKLVDEALGRAGTSDAEAVWALRVLRATLLIQGRRFDEASQILEKPLPQKLRNSETAARRLVAQAMLEWSHQKNSRELLEQARVIAVKHAPRVLPEILWLTSTEANVLEAIRLARKANNEVLVAKAEASLVLAYAGTGRFTEAIKLGEELRPRLDKLDLPALRKKHLGNLGWIYSEVGAYDEAAELLSIAVAEAGRMRDFNEQLIWFATLSNVHLTRRDWAAAVRDCRQVIDATAGETHRSRGHAFSTLARAYLELGKIAEARDAVRQSLELQTDKEDEFITRVVEARIDMAAGRHDAALATLRDVLARTSKPDTRLSAQSRLAQLHALAKRNVEAGKAFARAVELVRDARAAMKSADLRVAFFNTAAELFDDYVDFAAATGQADEALRITEISRAQTLAEGLDVAPHTRIDARQVAAQRNAVILCYWLGPRRSFVWTITPAAVKLTTLQKSDTDIERAAEAYRARLLTTAGTLTRSRPQGQALYDMLIAPAVQRLPRGARVVVVPDGKLHLLNFETLIVPGQQPRYWIEDVILSNASSLHLLARNGITPGAAQPSVLIVGNPPAVDPAFPRLPKAADEIRRIESQFTGRATVLAGSKATPATYAAAKPQAFDFVHFVAHGVAARTRPLDSAVILGPDSDRNYRLVARDIASRPIGARLVTISSCYGAGAATYAGEGLVGLAWAFLHAGAQQVVAALWAVNDSAAPGLMSEMYAGIRRGREPAEALREAKLRLLRSKTAHQQPMFWAPFVIYV